jgi:hypothetical protein
VHRGILTPRASVFGEDWIVSANPR